MIKKIRREIYNRSKILGEHFGFDLPYYIENGFWLSLSKFFELGFGVIITVIFARFTTQEIYGQYNLLISILAILSIISIPGLSVSALRSVSNGKHGVYLKAITLKFLWSLAGVPLLLIIGFWYYYSENTIMGICLLSAALFFPFYYSSSSWPVIYQGTKKFNKYSIFAIIKVSLSSLFIIAVIYNGTETVFPIFISYLIAHTGLNIFFFVLSLKDVENNETDNIWKQSGYKLTVFKFISLAYDYVDKLIIGFLLGPEKLAIYAIAVGINSYMGQLNGIVTRIIMPKLFNTSKKYFKDIFKKLIRIFSLGSVLSAFIMYFIVPWLITFLYSTKYSASISYSQIYIIAIPFYSLSTIFQLGLIYLEKETELTKIKLYTITINILLYLILIPYFGIMGAIIASLVYFLILDVIYIFKFIQIFKPAPK